MRIALGVAVGLLACAEPAARAPAADLQADGGAPDSGLPSRPMCPAPEDCPDCVAVTGDRMHPISGWTTTSTDILWAAASTDILASASNQLKRMPLGGGAAQTLVRTDASPSELTANATHVYWSDTREATVHRARLSSGGPELLATYQQAWGLQLDAEYLYWLSAESPATDLPAIVRQPLAGGELVTLGHLAHSGGTLLAENNELYWSDAEGGYILRVSRDGGEVRVFVSGQSGPAALATSNGVLYWSNIGNGGTVAAIPLVGGTPVTLVTRNSAGVGLAVRGSDLVWSEWRMTSTEPRCLDALIMHARLGSDGLSIGAPTVVAHASVDHLEIQGGWIFWRDTGDRGGLWKRALPTP